VKPFSAAMPGLLARAALCRGHHGTDENPDVGGGGFSPVFRFPKKKFDKPDKYGKI
jgi:hypothetical protein